MTGPPGRRKIQKEKKTGVGPIEVMSVELIRVQATKKELLTQKKEQKKEKLCRHVGGWYQKRLSLLYLHSTP
jgi:hypothetical protein